MKEIELTQGKVALVDDEDYDYLIRWKWYAFKSSLTYYAGRQMTYYDNGIRKQRRLLMHRNLMHPPKGMEIDHLDHNGLNNQKDNLRTVTHRQNQCNRIDNRKYIGVLKKNNRYVANIWINGKNKVIGRFDDPIDAHKCYLMKAGELNRKKYVMN